MRFLKFFELIKTVMENFSSRDFFFEITDGRFGLFLNRPHRTTANTSTPTLTQPTTQRRQHMLTRPNTTKHHQHTTKHNTHFQHRYMPTSFQVARGLHRNTWTVISCMRRTCSPNREWAAAALWHSGQVRAMCTERANWTSDHCHCH